MRILEGMEGVGSSGWNGFLVLIARRGSTKETHIGLKFGGIPFHELHEVPGVCGKEYFMAIFEFWSKILAGEIVIQLHKYDHGLCNQSIRGNKKARNGQLEESEVGSEKL